MGASGWTYYVGYDDDLSTVLGMLHRRVFEASDYFWHVEELERPASLDGLVELFADEEFEDFAAEGTHSILDIYQVKAAGSGDEFGTVIALSDAEIFDAFGTKTPTRAQFEAVYRDGEDLIAEFPRWSGRCAALYDGDRPVELVFWGYSGD